MSSAFSSVQFSTENLKFLALFGRDGLDGRARPPSTCLRAAPPGTWDSSWIAAAHLSSQAPWHWEGVWHRPDYRACCVSRSSAHTARTRCKLGTPCGGAWQVCRTDRLPDARPRNPHAGIQHAWKPLVGALQPHGARGGACRPPPAQQLSQEELPLILRHLRPKQRRGGHRERALGGAAAAAQGARGGAA